MKKKLLLLAAVAAGALTAAPSHALSAGNNADVTQAFADGATSVGLVVTGVITVAAVMTALSLVYSWLKK